MWIWVSDWGAFSSQNWTALELLSVLLSVVPVVHHSLPGRPRAACYGGAALLLAACYCSAEFCCEKQRARLGAFRLGLCVGPSACQIK